MKLKINTVRSDPVQFEKNKEEWQNSRRKLELQEAAELLHRPQLHGDQVLMIIQRVKVIYGQNRLTKEIAMRTVEVGAPS